MSEELKPCPFCGSEAKYGGIGVPEFRGVICANEHCPSNDYFYYDDVWNTRPLEDALRKQLEDREVQIVAMCAEEKCIKDERDILRKQLEAAMELFNTIDGDSFYQPDVRDMVSDTLAEIAKIGGEK